MRDQVAVDRADRRLIEQAARRLRDEAIRAGYAGLPSKHLAFALALVLDELARHVRDLAPELRRQTVASCHVLVPNHPSPRFDHAAQPSPPAP